MNRSPAESKAMPKGSFSSAAVAGPLLPAVTGDAVAGGGHDRARGARGEVRGAAVGGRDGVRARRQARGRERRHAVDQRRAADRSVLVAEGDRPPVRNGPARGQVADGRGERDRLSEGRRSGRGPTSAVRVGRARRAGHRDGVKCDSVTHWIDGSVDVNFSVVVVVSATKVPVNI